MTLIGHGIPDPVIADAFQAGQEFFGLPLATKMAIQEQRTNRGYQPMFDNVQPGHKPSSAEAFSMGHPMPPSDPALLGLPFYAATPWPDLPNFRPRAEACYQAMFALAQSALRAFTLHLKVAPDFFDRLSRNTYSNMRLIHYPPQETVAHITDVGVRPHEDQGLITLLIQDMNGGLAVRGPDGEWLPVVPSPNAVVLNVAKLLTRWTNGRFKSALHRVINTSGRERYSIPLFVHPDFHQVIDPRDLVGGEPDPRFPPIVAGEQVYANFAMQRVSWQAAQATKPGTSA